MTRPGRATQRAFTAVVCTGCADDLATSVLEALRDTIGRCRHGVLVRADCMLGRFICAVRPTGPGVMVLLQPCSTDRKPTGPALRVGPIDAREDIETLCGWLERGDWSQHSLPPTMGTHADWIRRSRATN